MSQSLEDGRLTAYLLGRLPPEEEEAVEAEYLGSADAYDRLQVAEDDLIDAYVGGHLPAEDVRRFEEHFLASPARRERVAFAQALRQRVMQKAERPASRPASLLLPVAAAVPLAVAGWLFLSVRELRTEVTRQHEQYAARSREAATDRARIASLERELAARRVSAGIVTLGVERVRGATKRYSSSVIGSLRPTFVCAYGAVNSLA